MNSFLELDALKPAAPLIKRAKADCEVAIVCVFSGMSAAADDQMRDVMEIEYLLRDFAHDLGQLQIWAAASPEQEKHLFSPNALRQREAKRQGVDPNQLQDATDYKSHSRELHVNKKSYRSVPRGIDSTFERTSDLHADMGVWELFWHSRNLLFAISDLYVAAGGQGEPPADDDAYITAWKAAQEAKTKYLKWVVEVVRGGKLDDSAPAVETTTEQGKSNSP